jgi:hypothetical protein
MLTSLCSLTGMDGLALARDAFEVGKEAFMINNGFY